MDKKAIIGILLIIGIMFSFFIINFRSQQDRQIIYHESDSIEIVTQKPYIKVDDSDQVVKKNRYEADSARNHQVNHNVGIFSSSQNGSTKLIAIENEVAKFKFSTLGGRICYVELKKYKTFDGLPLVLMSGDSTIFNFRFFANNTLINTHKLYFTPVFFDSRYAGKNSISIKANDSVKLAMRIYPDSAFNPQKNKYFELLYTLYGNNNMMKLHLNFVGMQQAMSGQNEISLEWKMNLIKQEKSLEAEKTASTIYYKYYEDKVDYLSETKSDQKDLFDKINWVSFKQQFFCSVLIADKGFPNAKIKVISNDSIKNEVKNCYAQLTIPIDRYNQSFPMRIYFGPNHYNTLRKYDLELEKQIPLGWSFPYVLGWINKYVVIPVFNLLETTGMNYGIIILILTILIKIGLLPIAYKTYMSSAKMRVLKPEIDEINERIPKEKAMERQQATMALYKKAGINPMAGCIPMLLQMPILIALYRFFPAAIELRQQRFLWANDLSTYDSIYNLGFTIPFYGDHISLFTLLMTISTIIYTKLNNKLMGNQQQMQGMNLMLYVMPIMFLGMFNNFSAGLNYYYFLANIFTFLQMWIFRCFVNEEAIHQKIQKNKMKPEQKKSDFQRRLEQLAKQNGYNLSNK